MHGDEAIAREAMVNQQIAGRGIRDARVLHAMRQIPRHAFVPEAMRAQAYDDHPIAIGRGQTISQPYMVGLMTEALELRPEDRVLEVGTGSGYQAAVLAALAKEVYTIERHPELARRARETLARLGITNVHVEEGDGSAGLPAHAPYDAIIVTAGGPHIPQPLTQQLALGGRLVCPAGDRKVQQLYRVVRDVKGFQTTRGLKCVFVPLIGDEGWQQREDDAE